MNELFSSFWRSFQCWTSNIQRKIYNRLEISIIGNLNSSLPPNLGQLKTREIARDESEKEEDDKEENDETDNEHENDETASEMYRKN